MAYNRKENPAAPVTGGLSGWNRITTQDAEGKAPVGDHQFTVADLVSVVRSLREEFSPQNLAAIEEMIRRHIDRKDNPHDTDLNKMHTSVLAELYQVWLAQGNKGTTEEFLKVLFQFVQIADIFTTREGEALNEVVSPRGLATVVNDHDIDLYAHDELFADLFPGAPVRALPTFSIQGHIGLPDGSIVRRSSPMTVVTSVGMVKEIPADTLEPDYSAGDPALPVFDTVENMLEESENFGLAGTWMCRHSELSKTTGIQSMRDYYEECWVLKELASPTPVAHEMLYIRETADILIDEYYTISVFVSPMGRTCFGIEIQDIIDEKGRLGFEGSKLLPFDHGTFMGTKTQQYRCIHYDTASGEVFINSKSQDLRGYIYPMYNGWYRLQFTFRALRSMPLQFRFYTLDLVDGDGTYEGTDGLGMAVFGAQVTKGAFLTPYVPSLGGTKGSIAATTVQVPINDSWYRRDAGTVVSVVNNNAIDARLDNNSSLYDIGAGTESLVALARMPVGNKNRVFMSTHGTNSTTLASTWTKPTKQRWLTTMQGYSLTKQLFGDSDGNAVEVPNTKLMAVNKVCDYLYLGCNRQLGNQLNGFIREWTFYPECLESGNSVFFAGRERQ